MVSPGRYGQPPGFGGGYTQPPYGEFQPGSEDGVIDPNLGRFTVCKLNVSMRANAATSLPSGARHYSATCGGMASHVRISRPIMNPVCA
jgi:hypothetical protein